VSGKVTPEMEKPAPDTVAELTVTDAVPVEVKVRVWVVAVPTETLPKVRLVALTVNVGVPGFKLRATVLLTLPALAVSVAVCALETDETVAVKLPVVEPAATVTEEGTETAVLLLARLTAKPPVAAAELRVTEHASVPDPVMVPLVQETPVRTGTPVPVKLTSEFPDEASPTIVSWPVAAPAAVGSNCTVRVMELPGVKVTGRVGAETVKPVPVTVAELTVTAAAPVEVTVTI
jgi:hypothetical protein